MKAMTNLRFNNLLHKVKMKNLVQKVKRIGEI